MADSMVIDVGRGSGSPRRLRLVRLAGLVDPLQIVGLLGLLGLWWGAHAAIGLYLPSPYEVFDEAFSNLFSSPYLQGLGLPPGGYFPNLVATTGMTLGGVVLGSLLGVVSGFACGRYRLLKAVLDPVIATLGTIPVLVATPFCLIWFGLALSAKIALVAFYSIVVVHLYTTKAIDHVPPFYAEYARTLGASRSRCFVDVIFPASIPEMFGGIRLALSSAWGLATISELMGSRTGIGRLIAAAWAAYDMTAMMAAILWLCIIAVLFDLLLMRARSMATRWADRSPSEEVWS